MHRLLPKLFLFFVVALNAQTKLSEVEAEALRNKVKAVAQQTETISSHFVQYKHLDFLSNDIKTSGELAFKSPNLVKWEYTDPFKYSVIFKDEKLHINNQGSKSKVDIGSSKMFKQLNQLIINSVKGDMFDANAFTIAYYKLKDNYEVHFSPKDNSFSEFIEQFQLTFNAKGDVVKVKMIEPSKDYTLIEFSNRLVNKPLDDSIFTN